MCINYLVFTIYDGISLYQHYQQPPLLLISNKVDKDNHYLRRPYSQIVLSDSIWSSTAADKIGIFNYII